VLPKCLSLYVGTLQNPEMYKIRIFTQFTYCPLKFRMSHFTAKWFMNAIMPPRYKVAGKFKSKTTLQMPLKYGNTGTAAKPGRGMW
jgi:hypothetical protein